MRDKNSALRDFLDMFNHRALSLFVRAAGKYRLPLAFEGAQGRGLDAISGALLALSGMRGAALLGRQAISDRTLMFYAGHLAHRPRTAGALGQILSEYFRRPVWIRQFQGRWARLQRAEQTRLGGRATAADAYARLGQGAILGSRVWDVQGSFRVGLGPLNYAQFRTLMPGAAQMRELAALTRTYVGPALSFDVQLTLKAREIPPLVLSRNPEAGPRLGWNSWLPSRGPRFDADDAKFGTDRGAG